MPMTRLYVRTLSCLVLIVSGCASVQGTLVQSGPSLASEYRSIYSPDVLEKAQSGSLAVTLEDGERCKGAYVGYLPKTGAHCAKSGLKAAVGYVSPYPGAGFAELDGTRGTKLHCFYIWNTDLLQKNASYCQREAVCKASDGRYFKIIF